MKYTPADLQNYIDSRDDIFKFASNLRIYTPNGYKLLELNDLQIRLITAYRDNKNTYASFDRQNGVTTALMVIALHEAVFHEHKTVAMSFYKLAYAKNIAKQLKDMLHSLPLWWFKVSRNTVDLLELDSGSRILFTSTCTDRLRETTITNLLIDCPDSVSNSHSYRMESCSIPMMCSKSSKILAVSTGYTNINTVSQSVFVEKLKQCDNFYKLLEY